MKGELTALISDNPMVTLSLPLMASTRELRQRLDGLELELAINGSGHERSQLRAARRLVDDPLLRIECEFFASWAGTACLESVAMEHDAALTGLRRVMGRGQSVSWNEALHIVGLWLDLLSQATLLPAIEQRLTALEVRVSPRAWHDDIVASAVLPAMVSRLLDYDGGMALEIGSRLTQLGPDAARPSATALARYVAHQVTDERLAALTVRQTTRFVSIVARTMALVHSTAPEQWSPTMSTLAEEAHAVAVRSFKADRADDAIQVLEAVASIDLPESDAIRISADLAYVKYQVASSRAQAHFERREWNEAIAALEQAAALAPDAERAEQARQMIIAIRARYRTGNRPR
jgi:hypothetical protein